MDGATKLRPNEPPSYKAPGAMALNVAIWSIFGFGIFSPKTYLVFYFLGYRAENGFILKLTILPTTSRLGFFISILISEKIAPKVGTVAQK